MIEAGVMQSQAKGHLGSPEAGRGRKGPPTQRLEREHGPADSCISDSGLQYSEKLISVFQATQWSFVMAAPGNS